MMKTVVQCDFDGTVTIGEVSRLLLEEFADGDWQNIGKDYTEGRISVQTCNIMQFAMVKAGRRTMTDFLLNSGRVKIRPGFNELIEYCARHSFDFVIVSNGLRFYIKTILDSLGIDGIDIHAAHCRFSPGGMELTYSSPDSGLAETGFKEIYARILRESGYDVMYYLGNGASDIYPARQADHIFAVDGLLECCRRDGIRHTPFETFHDVIRGLESIS